MVHDIRSPDAVVMVLKGHDDVITDVQMDDWKVTSGRWVHVRAPFHSLSHSTCQRYRSEPPNPSCSSLLSPKGSCIVMNIITDVYVRSEPL